MESIIFICLCLTTTAQHQMCYSEKKLPNIPTAVGGKNKNKTPQHKARILQNVLKWWKNDLPKKKHALKFHEMHSEAINVVCICTVRKALKYVRVNTLHSLKIATKLYRFISNLTFSFSFKLLLSPQQQTSVNMLETYIHNK